MSKPLPARKAPSRVPDPDRRVPVGPVGSLSWLKSLFGRPLSMIRLDGKWQLVLGERRALPLDAPPPLTQLRMELRERLLAHSHHHAAKVMRHLVQVHDELGRKGWPGVEAMPSMVLGRALVQAEMLASDEPSRGLAVLVDRLRVIHVAAQLREERQARYAGQARSVEVSEATHEEFEETERSWVGVLPPGLPRPEDIRKP